MSIERTCPMCEAPLAAADADAMGDLMIEHVADAHPDLPFPREAIWNFGSGLARLTGSTERLDAIGAIEVHPVSEERLSDWLHLFDHDVFAGKPEWSACYCTEPHWLQPGDSVGESNRGTWRDKRERMIERFRSGDVFGYLAYVDGKPAGWVNASKRADYSLFRRGDDEDQCTIGIACFAIAPPYRGHGVSKALLDRVIADAAARGADWVEAYPFDREKTGEDNPDFRGPRAMYDERGFTQVTVRQERKDAVVRRPV
jgi:GNAT superfamily N-acetyltransferase